jgi:hypothetical protein
LRKAAAFSRGLGVVIAILGGAHYSRSAQRERAYSIKKAALGRLFLLVEFKPRLKWRFKTRL